MTDNEQALLDNVSRELAKVRQENARLREACREAIAEMEARRQELARLRGGIFVNRSRIDARQDEADYLGNILRCRLSTLLESEASHEQ